MEILHGAQGFILTMWELVVKYWPFFVDGVRATLIIAFFGVIFGFILGTLLTLMRMTPWKILRWPANAFVEFFRGTPLLVQLMFIFYGLPAVGIVFPEVSFIPDFSRFAAGIVAMSRTRRPMFPRWCAPESRLWIKARPRQRVQSA